MMLSSRGVKSLLAKRTGLIRGSYHPILTPSIQNFATVGDKVPSVELHKGFPPEKINMADYCKDKNVVFVGLPGAFTPT